MSAPQCSPHSYTESYSCLRRLKAQAYIYVFGAHLHEEGPDEETFTHGACSLEAAWDLDLSNVTAMTTEANILLSNNHSFNC